MKKVLAIINPVSGTRSKLSIANTLSEVINDTDYQLFVTYTKYAGHGYELAREAVEQNYHIVIAVGGDGTVNEIARALVHSQTALAIIPKGSGNGLARSLGVSMNIKKACELLKIGEIITIDTCQANELPFFCTCGMGFDADVSKAFIDSPLRGFITYSKIALEKYIKYEPETYSVTMEGLPEVKDTKAFVVVAANASQYGNNAYIAPKANMTDGLLDIVIIEPFKSITLPHISLQLFTQKLQDNSSYTTYQTTSATFRREKDGVMHLDGESVTMPREVKISLKAQSLKVLVPKDFKA